MDELRERVRHAIIRRQLARPGDRVLVGVSGGPDSVALLHALLSLREALRLTLIVVHVDHRLREDSARDAAFVEELARRWGVPVMVATRDVRAETARRRLSLEDGARRIRYEVFRDVALAHSADRLALAHTADDQAETVLMRLIRGAGVTGLGAMAFARPFGELTVIRPLLGLWRTDILTYLRDHHLAFRRDPSNDDPRFLRNRIRTQLLPLLERDYNPNIKALLIQLADQCRLDAAFVEETSQRTWRRLVKSQDGQVAIRTDAFLRQPAAVQQGLIRLVIQRLQGGEFAFAFRHWLEIERLFATQPVGTELDLPGRVQFRKDAGHVVCRVASRRGHSTSPDS